jgi:hypothetical protein
VAGGAAAVTAALPRTGPVAESLWTLTVSPTFDAVPSMRKSPLFQVARVIVIWSVIRVGVNGADLADSAP